MNAVRRYFSISETESYTGIPKSTLYKKVERHEIPHIRVGKVIKFDVLEIDSYMAKNRVKVARKVEAFYEPGAATGVDNHGV